MNEQKYSRNMALSFLAGIALGAVIVLVLLWALGYISCGEGGQAAETGADFALSGTGAESPSENRETIQEPGGAVESSQETSGETESEPMQETSGETESEPTQETSGDMESEPAQETSGDMESGKRGGRTSQPGLSAEWQLGR